MTAGVVGVVALVCAAVGAVAMTHQPSRVADSGYTAPQYDDQSGRPTEAPATTTRESVTTTPETTSTEPTTTEAPQPPPSDQQPTEQQPAGPQPVARLGDNPLFDADLGLPATDCDLPRFDSSVAGQDRFNQAALGCLMRAWAPVMQAANLPLTTPKIVDVAGGTLNTPCGVQQWNSVAFYCGDDETIYWTPNYYANVEQLGNYPGRYLGNFAHEFGHHIQEMSGLMGVYADQRQQAGEDTDAGLLLSRRLELEANCFSGEFVAATAGHGSVTVGMANESAQDMANRGDFPNNGKPPDHGLPQWSGAWWSQGYTKNRTAQCDTWLSPPDQVA